MKKNLYLSIFLCLLVMSGLFTQSFAQVGHIGSHDPSTLVKDGNRYWMFTTGDGIYAASSPDLHQWTAARRPIFPIGTWPAWINQAVPGFAGHFWAPDCIYMNGRYYLYYSCSTFGSSRSAIGVATSPTLDENSPDYRWTDQGMVVSSDGSSNAYNAIDPALFRDSNGRIYMTYGSFFGGIVVMEIDPATGKRRSGTSTTRIAGGNHADWEAARIIKEGSYYYLFANRGSCCRGTNSTYRIVMGRSTNINGPYLDRSGVDMRNGGGTLALGNSGKFIGPGHFALLREGGSNFVSMHYYDASDNGNAKLDIANLGFSNGWPFITRDWIAQGRYRVTNRHSGMVWDAWGCTGASGQAIAQGNWAGRLCQQWDFVPVGDGFYRINAAQGGLSADVQNCSPSNGAKLQLWNWLNNDCQKFKVQRLSNGNHIFTSATGNRVVEVPARSTTAGTQLALWDYNGGNNQRWSIQAPTVVTSLASEEDLLLKDITSHRSQLYPNPSASASVSVRLSDSFARSGPVDIEILTIDSRQVYKKSFTYQEQLEINSELQKGVYLVRISSNTRTEVVRWVIRQ
jgi:arabinan endo-1,5-alpha-L-arabinosidase